jgi:spore coat protein CotF
MEDKNLMQDILLLEKGACDLYMHGSIEAATPNVNQTFKAALNESLTLQDSIYQQMKSRGWYAPEAAQQSQIDTLRQKYQNQLQA